MNDTKTAGDSQHHFTASSSWTANGEEAAQFEDLTEFNGLSNEVADFIRRNRPEAVGIEDTSILGNLFEENTRNPVIVYNWHIGDDSHVVYTPVIDGWYPRIAKGATHSDHTQYMALTQRLLSSLGHQPKVVEFETPVTRPSVPKWAYTVDGTPILTKLCFQHEIDGDTDLGDPINVTDK